MISFVGAARKPNLSHPKSDRPSRQLPCRKNLSTDIQSCHVDIIFQILFFGDRKFRKYSFLAFNICRLNPQAGCFFSFPQTTLQAGMVPWFFLGSFCSSRGMFSNARAGRGRIPPGVYPERGGAILWNMRRQFGHTLQRSL